MKFVMTGVTGLRNRGVEALVSATLDGIHRHVPGASITIVSPSADYDRMKLGEAAEVVPPPPYGKYVRIKSLLRAVREGRSPRVPAFDAIRAATCVVASGGDVFSSDYGSMPNHLRPLHLAREAGKPYVFLAHSIGPFKTQAEIDQWAECARDAALITVREHMTYEYLVEKVGLPADRVIHTTDVAFLLTPPPPEQLDALAAFYGIGAGVPTVAVAPSLAISSYVSMNPQQHQAAWVETIRTIRQEWGARVVIVPHVQELRISNDDRIIATRVARALGWDPDVRLAIGDHSASEYKGLIGRCDFVIAERMHAAIAGLGSGVPTFVVGYSVKARGIASDIFGDAAPESLITAVDFVDRSKRAGPLNAAWQNRQATTTRLQAMLPEIRRRADKNFELLAGVVGARPAGTAGANPVISSPPKVAV
jgi:colanic acid/amylovoran biosynthesis protein